MISRFDPSRAGRLVLILVLLLALIGCGEVQQAATPTPPAPTGETPGFVLDIHNDSQAVICYVFMVPVSYPTDWDVDQLGLGGWVEIGENMRLSGIAEGQYDVKTEDCDHNVLSWNFDQTVASDSVLAVNGATDQLIIQNIGEASICAVWAWIAGDVMWHRAQIYDPTTPIVPGSQRSIPLQNGDWNVRIQTCDGVSQDYTLPITGPTLLTYPPAP